MDRLEIARVPVTTAEEMDVSSELWLLASSWELFSSLDLLLLRYAYRFCVVLDPRQSPIFRIHLSSNKRVPKLKPLQKDYFDNGFGQFDVNRTVLGMGLIDAHYSSIVSKIRSQANFTSSSRVSDQVHSRRWMSHYEVWYRQPLPSALLVADCCFDPRWNRIDQICNSHAIRGIASGRLVLAVHSRTTSLGTCRGDFRLNLLLVLVEIHPQNVLNIIAE